MEGYTTIKYSEMKILKESGKHHLLFLLAALRSYASINKSKRGENWCNFSSNSLAEKLMMPRRTVSRQLQELVELDLISIEISANSFSKIIVTHDSKVTEITHGVDANSSGPSMAKQQATNGQADETHLYMYYNNNIYNKNNTTNLVSSNTRASTSGEIPAKLFSFLNKFSEEQILGALSHMAKKMQRETTDPFVINTAAKQLPQLVKAWENLKLDERRAESRRQYEAKQTELERAARKNYNPTYSVGVDALNGFWAKYGRPEQMGVANAG